MQILPDVVKIEGRLVTLPSSITMLLSEMESSTQVHALVYNAQELGLIPKKHEFDYSMNVPFSESLEKELLCLERKQGAGNMGNESIDHECAHEGLSRLAQLNTKELVNLSRVLYLKKTFPELNDDEQELQEKARKTFFLSKDKFINVMNIFQSKEMRLTLSEA